VNESTRTSKLLSRLRKRNPDWLVWKISGQMTGGWPDAFVAGPRGHAWVEFKNVAPGENPQDSLTELQRRTITKLDSFNQDCYVVGLYPDGSQAVYFFTDDEPSIEPSKTALQDELESLC
jgi:hypothetical protein